ncbi:nitrate ABC transporter permease [Paractinoplanes deccanensis]|uniref:Nitrate ABC transporter permease n=1 Tax=Paractinoplanes deccanensis TaxID=113561 RepID=A0ABQ3YHP5_9ACTN|nr:ABC transporter permease subunit [Actinoplanes deccanensis]GID79489.1 nitrate ABC transporter permease [Actinoplanes deccanensis]
MRWLRGAAGVAVVVAAFELLGRAGIVHEDFLPPASAILSRAGSLVADGEFLADVRATLTAWALGLLIATAVAVPLGLVLGSLPPVARALTPVIELLRPIPSVALIPLVAMLLGSGLQMRLTVIVYAATWPILFNTLYGLLDVDPVARDTLRAFGFGRLAVLARVCVPATAPFIATGVRMAAAVALILAVTAEMFGGFGDGIGIFIAQAANYPGGTTDTLAATVWAGALGLAINALLRGGERRLFFWAYR